MAEDPSEVNELYGRGLDGKLWVMNGRLAIKEVKKEEEEQEKSIGEGIENNGEKTSDARGKGNDASSFVSAHPSQPPSVNAFIHPQLPMKVEEGQMTMNGGDSMVDEVQNLRAASVEYERRQLAQLESRLFEEQHKSAKLAEELKLEKDISQNMVASSVGKEMAEVETSVATSTIQPSRSAIAARLLGIDSQLLDEPPPNEFKEKFEEADFNLRKMRNAYDALLKDHRQEQMKYSKVKQLYKGEQKVAAQLRKKLKEKENLVNTGEPAAISLDDQQQPMEEESTGPITSPPLDAIQLGARLLSTIEVKEKSDANITVASAPTGGGVFKCQTCPDDHVAYSSADQLAKHQRYVHSDRQHLRHQCPECGQRCQSNYDLQNHMRTHSDEKPHTCQQCGKDFAKKANLTRHERVHTGERPYVCTVCQKTFTTPDNLVRHARVHSGETPYSCRHCARPFNQASGCRTHEKICPKRDVRETE